MQYPKEWIIKAVNYDSTFTKAFTDIASKLYAENRLIEATKIFSALIEANPLNYEAWNDLGVVLFSLSDTATAEKCFNKALSLNPNYEEVTRNLELLCNVIVQDKPAESVGREDGCSLYAQGPDIHTAIGRRPTVHFVYSGNPQNDQSHRAPERITNHLYRALEREFDVCYYEWTDTRPVQPPLAGNIVLGHPHLNPNTALKQLFQSPAPQLKLLIFPFHHGLSHIAMPFDSLVRQADHVFAISGQYWFDTLADSPFAHWGAKMTRVDMAVDVKHFHFQKKTFNSPGRRVFLYIGRDLPEKGVASLAQLIRVTQSRLLYIGHIGASRPLFDGLDVEFLSEITLTPEGCRWLAQKCDFFVNMSVSDANPTTILEMSAIGLPVLGTPQSGYIRPDLVFPLSLNNMAYNVAVVNALQTAGEDTLHARARSVRMLVEREYSWDKFTTTVIEGIQELIKKRTQCQFFTPSIPISTQKAMSISMRQTQKCWCNGVLVESVHPLYGQCHDCGTLVLKKQLTEEQLKNFYSLNGYWHEYQVNISKYPPIEERASNDFGDRIPVWYQLLRKYKPALESLCEIGCAHGGFLYYCHERGVKNVVGVEVDEETCEFARKHFNLPYVVSGLFPKVTLPFDRFDAVTGFDVIEHFSDTIEGMKAVARLLKDGGICLFQTPCYRGEGREWIHFRADEHTFLFNPQSIKRLFDCAGLGVMDILPGFYPGDMFVIGHKKALYHSLLFIRTDSIGDNVLAASMLQHIREKYKDAKITVVCQAHISELYEACPFVDDIVPFDRVQAYQDERYRTDIVKRLRTLNADLALNSVYSRESLTDIFTIESGAQNRIAFNGNLCNISKEIRDRHNQFYTKILPSNGAHKLELERYRDFLQGIGIEAPTLQPMIWTTPEDEQYADDFFRANNLEPNLTIALFAGVQDEKRLFWHYGGALSRICKVNQFAVIALGAANDYDINQHNLDAIGVKGVNLCGKTSLRQSAALLRRCRLAVGAETGLSHIACAVETPNVILLGGGHFGRFIPYSPLTSVVCLPLECYGCNWQCKHQMPPCVWDIAPEVIIEAVLQTLGQPSKKSRLFMQGTSLWNPQPGQPQWKSLDYYWDVGTVEIIPVEKKPLQEGGKSIEINTPQFYHSSVPLKTDSSTKIDVSFIIATKNRAQLLNEMLSSLERAAYGINYEIIAIEGGSSDNTLEILHKHGVEQIYNETEYLGEGWHTWPQLYNFGFYKARGKWGMYASDDITFQGSCIAKAIEILNKQTAEVAGGIFFYKNVFAEPGWEDYGIDFTYGQKLLMNYGLVRMDDFRVVSGLDERYRFYCADGDLCLKLYEAGKQIIPLAGCFIIHNNILDRNKKTNLRLSQRDIDLYLERWKYFVPTTLQEQRRLMWQDDGTETAAASTKEQWPDNELESRNGSISLDQLRKAGVLRKGQPLRLHLGCGEQYLEGYINIDYPSTEHTVQTNSVADFFADIVALNFPKQTVDELRLHHVFEHFDRPTALALLCKWHRWLKIGGTLIIETPDFEASLELIRSHKHSYKEKQAVLRHIFGSHEAGWATHRDGWYQEKFTHVLTTLGFEDIKFDNSQWQMTCNITVITIKKSEFDDNKLSATAKYLLEESLIDHSPSEEQINKVWFKNFERIFHDPDSKNISPTVSIFMPVYNGERYLADAIVSLLNQTFHDFEIIIADDGSTDRSLEIARTFAEHDCRIKVVALQHAGEVRTRNEAIRHTNPGSKYLLNHDSDDISMPTKLERLVNYLLENPSIAIVGCFAEYFDDENNKKGNPPIEWQPKRIRETFSKVNSMINSAALIRRHVFEKNAGYREEYSSVDDYDFFARALMAGFNMANIPEVLHRIRLHPASVGSTRSATQQILSRKIQETYKSYLKANHVCKKSKTCKSGINTDKSLSILHTVEFYYPHVGGAEIVVQQLSERLARQGHRVTVATTELPNRNFKELNGVEVREFNVSGSIGNGIRGSDISNYREFLKDHPCDVMMNYAAQEWATDIAFDVLSVIKYRRVNIIAPCGYSALADNRTVLCPQFLDYFNNVIPTVIPLYDAAIYHSAMYKDYEYAQGHHFKNSVIIPNGVDGEEFSKKPEVDFRGKYNIKTRYFGLCVANFYPGKGHERVIECVRQMNRRDFTMIFIGKEGGQLKNLESQASELNIRFLVDIPREDTVAAYYSADIFLLGSEIEASPLVIIEAKASRTPFVSTDCGNVKEWKGGFVCAPEEMAEKANRVLNDSALHKQLAEEGWVEWKEKLTWETIVDKYEDLYWRLHYKKTRGRSENLSPPAWGFQLEDIQQKIEGNYLDISLYLEAGKILLSNNQPDEAKKYIEDALELDPNNSDLFKVYKQLSR